MIIREIETISEMREVEEIQKEVWGVADREVFPVLALIPMKEVGALLLGAFEGEHMAGFVFGFPGFESPHRSGLARHPGRRPIIHSDMLAVRPEYRSRGLGYKLKLAQRQCALEKGIDTITWTFDPLQAVNARLNFGKLGVTADRYLVNYYGETTSFLHSTGTDRLWVTWQLDSKRVGDRISGDSPHAFPALGDTSTILAVNEKLEPIGLSVQDSATLIAIEIPADINRLLTENAELARRWREATRAAFTRAIGTGFVVTDFHPTHARHAAVGRYFLTANLSPKSRREGNLNQVKEVSGSETA
jgi:chorismate synthase